MALSICPTSLTSLHLELYLLLRPRWSCSNNFWQLCKIWKEPLASNTSDVHFNVNFWCIFSEGSRAGFLEKKPEPLVCYQCTISSGTLR